MTCTICQSRPADTESIVTNWCTLCRITEIYGTDSAKPAAPESVTPPPTPQHSHFGYCPICDELDDLTDKGICYGCHFIADEATSGLYTYAPEQF